MKPIIALALAGVAALAGCDPETGTTTLTESEWRIEDIAGRGVIDNSPASLQFLPDGTLAGNAGCNRLMGHYEAGAGTMTLTPAGTTMMACVPALMHQEAALLDLLPKIEKYSIDPQGRLILTAQDGRTITATSMQ